MANQKWEWLRGVPTTVDMSGGSRVVPGRDEEFLVSFGKFGEFGVDAAADGSIIASFPREGLLAHYQSDGEMDMVSVSVVPFILSLDEDRLAAMPDGGASLRAIVSHLLEEETHVFIAITPALNEIEVAMNRRGETKVAQGSQEQNLSEGTLNAVKLGDKTLYFSVEDRGDELVVGIGEMKGDSFHTVAMTLAKYIRFSDVFDGTSDVPLTELAERILIN